VSFFFYFKEVEVRILDLTFISPGKTGILIITLLLLGPFEQLSQALVPANTQQHTLILSP